MLVPNPKNLPPKRKNKAVYLKRQTLVLIGDFIILGVKIKEFEKTRIQEYSGLVIAKKNKNLNATITIQLNSKNIRVEYCFLINSLHILFIKIIYSINCKRAKLYFLKKQNLKIKVNTH